MNFATQLFIELAPVYDAIVIGSGYGGGVAASRLSRMGFKVAVLEQGRNWQPGEFPKSANDQRKLTRFGGRVPRLGDPTGLYQLTVGRGLSVFAATGLGGGSLINAGVALRPDMDRLRRCGWPTAVTSDGLLGQGLNRAEVMLGVAPAPRPERFAKFAGMQRAAEAAGCRAQLPAMTIAHSAGCNAAGVTQNACEYCGDCWSGCNAGAKGTVGITYIADAQNHGADVFCECRAEAISKDGDGWEVVVQELSGPKRRRTVKSKIVVLAAGTMGTNELMLRARDRGLPLSTMLGEKFSANGDDLVLASSLDKSVNAIATGYPPRAPEGHPLVGPHSMSLIDLGDEDGPLCLHEGTMLSVMAMLAPLRAVLGLDFGRAMKLLRSGIYGEEQSRTQIFYIVGHDRGNGKLRLRKNNVIVEWPGYSKDPARVRAEEKVKAVVEGMGGVFQSNPFVLRAFGGNRIIAHPLGGCAMGETVHDGVVAHDGRVFDPTKGSMGVHEGLYVCDGAAIPTSVGVSPLLTISGLAERAMILAAARYERKLDTTPKFVHPQVQAAG